MRAELSFKSSCKQKRGTNADYSLIGPKPDNASVLSGILHDEFSCTV